MDFNDTLEEAAFRETVRTWMQDNASHDLHDKLEADRAEWTEEERLREAKAWQLKKQRAGWACMQWPKEYGGRGRDSHGAGDLGAGGGCVCPAVRHVFDWPRYVWTDDDGLRV